MTDLTGLEYGYTLKNEIKLESKKAAKSRGVASPDMADALALTYVLPVYPSRLGFSGTQQETTTEYDPFI